MKKTMVIIILVVFIASIAIVNFFGLEIKVFDGITYVEKIECDTITIQNENPVTLTPSRDLNGIPLFVFEFIPPENGEYTTDEESILANPNAVQINYEVFPHIADETGVVFEYDQSSNIAVFHELSRTFTILKPNKVFTITVRSTDGSNKSTTISVIGVPKKN
jgi:hypothetical protein